MDDMEHYMTRCSELRDELAEKDQRIEELETAKCPIMQDTIRRGDLAVKNLELIEERHALQARVEELEKAGAFNEFREVMLKVHNLLGVSTDQTFKNIAAEMYTKIKDLQAQIKAARGELEAMEGCSDGIQRSSRVAHALKILTSETGKGDG